MKFTTEEDFKDEHTWGTNAVVMHKTCVCGVRTMLFSYLLTLAFSAEYLMKANIATKFNGLDGR